MRRSLKTFQLARLPFRPTAKCVRLRVPRSTTATSMWTPSLSSGKSSGNAIEFKADSILCASASGGERGVDLAQSAMSWAWGLQKVGDAIVPENLGTSPARRGGARLLRLAGSLCLRRDQRHQAPRAGTPL